jgi:hypothetical protein
MSIFEKENTVSELGNEGACRGEYEGIDKDHWPEGGKMPDSSQGRKGGVRAKRA